MILMKRYTYDIEVAPNLFMITVKSVTTKKARTWYIWDVDGTNHLKEIVAFFNHRSRTFIGYNSIHYDNQIIHYLIRNYRQLSKLPTSEVTIKIFAHSNAVIGQNNNDYKYDKFFGTIDLMKLISIGMQTKPLKRVAVNLKWPLILESPHDFRDFVDSVAVLEEIKRYNINDVDITEALYHHLDLTGKDEKGAIEMRELVGNSYGVDVLSESDSGMGLKVFEQMYCENAGVSSWDLKNMKNTEDCVLLGDVISPKVRFKSPHLQKLLQEIRGQMVWQARKGEKQEARHKFNREVKIGNTTYTLAKGGLHSNHEPSVYFKEREGRMIDADVTSFYPYIVILLMIAPRHLNKEAFVRTMLTMITDRVAAKKIGDFIKAYAMKIGANSCFGRFGFLGHWLFDLNALYGVTLNGELFLLMLIEALELAGIEVIYANTDGITANCKNKKEEERFNHICKAWMKYTGFSLDFDFFDKFFIRDVNNYLVVKEGGKLKVKGDLKHDQYETPMKSFDCPVVPLAVQRYLIEGVPVEKTIREHQDPLDFCMEQKVGDTFSDVYYEKVDVRKREVVREKVQRINRYLVSTEGGFLLKAKGTKMEGMTGVAGKTVLLINDYDAVKKEYADGFPIDYSYYIGRALDLVGAFYPLLPEVQLHRKKGQRDLFL